MVNKKGFIKITEAIIAILIILSVLIIISQKRNGGGERDLTELIPPLLDEIAKNSTLRSDISDVYHLGGDLSSAEENINREVLLRINEFARLRIKNPGLGFSFKICKVEDVCSLETVPQESGGEISSHERVISTVFEKERFEPRKLKMFLWRKI